MQKSKVEILAHSIAPSGDELITIEGTFPRIVLSEVNTHRMLSKNTSSSRAIPFFKMVKTVTENPFIPYAFQSHHSGMQGTKYLDPDKKILWSDIQVTLFEEFKKHSVNDIENWEEVEFALNEYVKPMYDRYPQGLTPTDWWLELRNSVVSGAIILYGMGVTKQICNRLLEPFMWVTDIITGNKESWDAFFKLRCPQYQFLHIKGDEEEKIQYRSWKDVCKNEEFQQEVTLLERLECNRGQAEIHLMEFAEKCYDAINRSTPKHLDEGQWHIPYLNRIAQLSKNHIPLYDGIKIATAMAANTSYTIVGGSKVSSTEKWIELYDNKLINQDPPHSSPFEHCARAMVLEDNDEEGVDSEYNHFIKGNDLGQSPEFGWCNNFRGFIPLRYLIEKENFKI